MKRIDQLRLALGRGRHLSAGLFLLLVALLLGALRVEPVHTYFYLFAWYPALLALDGLTARKAGRSLLADHPLALLSMTAWSVPFWLLFEALNLRLENWYYVNTPTDPLLGRLFLVLSFATVLPGLMLTYHLFAVHRLFDRVRTPEFRVTPGLVQVLVGSGLLMLALVLVWPGWFFPLAWGFLILLLEPFNRRLGWPSLLLDLERGRPARLLRLCLAGLVCGLFWEIMNMPARARWIYTVPFFEDHWAVEMPGLGMLGFVPFALEAYAFLRTLEILGLTPPFERDRRAPLLPLPVSLRLFVLPVLVAGGSVAAIVALERHTVDSRIATVDQLESANRREVAILELAGVDQVAELLAAGATQEGVRELAELLMTPTERVRAMLTEGRLMEHRGLGAENARLLNAVGIHTVSQLARWEPEQLGEELSRIATGGQAIVKSRVRVWVRAARGE